jgi:hypothetical protein
MVCKFFNRVTGFQFVNRDFHSQFRYLKLQAIVKEIRM